MASYFESDTVKTLYSRRRFQSSSTLNSEACALVYSLSKKEELLREGRICRNSQLSQGA